MERKDRLIYKKRFYLLPFKPLLDYEYKRFGYKKCDVQREKGKPFNTVYYVTHSERREGMAFKAIYTLNYICSLYRTLVFPITLLLFLPGVLVENLLQDVIEVRVDIGKTLVYLMLPAVLSTILTVFLVNAAYRIAKNEEYDGKADRALISHGWTKWTSYKDNDPRFTPPGGNRKNAVSGAAHKNKASAAPVNPPHRSSRDSDDNDDDDIVTLQAANGEMIDFQNVALIAIKGKLYAILSPVEKVEGMADDEALVFECLQDDSGEVTYNIEDNDTIIDEVFESYNKLYNEQNKK